MGERQSLRLCEAAEVLGYSPSTFRRLLKDGKVPGPIDPSLPPKLRRWSRPLLERYITPLVPEVEADATPPHGIQRPLYVVGGAS